MSNLEPLTRQKKLGHQFKFMKMARTLLNFSIFEISELI